MKTMSRLKLYVTTLGVAFAVLFGSFAVDAPVVYAGQSPARDAASPGGDTCKRLSRVRYHRRTRGKKASYIKPYNRTKKPPKSKSGWRKKSRKR